MTQDYARKKRKSGAVKRKRQAPASKQPPANTWAWFFSGVLCGVFLCFLAWLAAQQPDSSGSAETPRVAGKTEKSDEPGGLIFTFPDALKEQDVSVEVDPADVARARKSESMDQYLLQAGSFRQHEDADRRRGELLLLGLDPKVQETQGKNGRWYRVFIGPFESRSKLNKARSLLAQQGIESLLLKRPSD